MNGQLTRIPRRVHLDQDQLSTNSNTSSSCSAFKSLSIYFVDPAVELSIISNQFSLRIEKERFNSDRQAVRF